VGRQESLGTGQHLLGGCHQRVPRHQLARNAGVIDSRSHRRSFRRLLPQAGVEDDELAVMGLRCVVTPVCSAWRPCAKTGQSRLRLGVGGLRHHRRAERPLTVAGPLYQDDPDPLADAVQLRVAVGRTRSVLRSLSGSPLNVSIASQTAWTLMQRGQNHLRCPATSLRA
jgi:hypothetical protein